MLLAALHLISFSQLSGCTTDWQPAFSVVSEWLAHTGLLVDDNPALTLRGLSPIAQLLVKAALWLDTFSSLTQPRPPKFLRLLKRLMGERGGFWADADALYSLRMDLLTGCPDEAMLAIAETSALAHWKATELRNGSLSYRDLIRRGDDIEQRLRHHTSQQNFGDIDQAPLHPNLAQTSVTESGVVPFPSNDMRRQVADVFRETAVMYLHTVLNNSNPGVREISECVEIVVRLMDQLPSSDIDRALMFPVCLAGCMTNDSTRRDFFKGRLQLLDGSIGNVMQTRLVMEAVWQKRDVNGGAVELRDTVRERGLTLLLV